SSFFVSLLFLFLSERKAPELSRALLSLIDGVVLILTTVPIANPQALVRVVEFDVRLMRIPRLLKGRRIVDPNIHAHRFVIDLLPDLDSLDLIGIVRLRPLIDAGLQLIRVNDQPLSIPKTYRVAVIERIPIRFGRVIAAVGVDTANIVDHFVDQPGLVRSDDE